MFAARWGSPKKNVTHTHTQIERPRTHLEYTLGTNTSAVAEAVGREKTVLWHAHDVVAHTSHTAAHPHEPVALRAASHTHQKTSERARPNLVRARLLAQRVASVRPVARPLHRKQAALRLFMSAARVVVLCCRGHAG